jgi:sRNA-binding protein
MAVALPWMIGGAIGMEALGQYQSGQAAAAQAKGQQAVAEYNAKVAEQQAKAEEQATAYKQRTAAEEAARYQSSIEAGLGTSGVVQNEGAPLLVQATQAAQSELDNMMIGYEGQVAAGQSRNQAGLNRLQGDIFGQQAKSAKAAGAIGAGTSLLSGFAGLG